MAPVPVPVFMVKVSAPVPFPKVVAPSTVKLLLKVVGPFKEILPVPVPKVPVPV